MEPSSVEPPPCPWRPSASSMRTGPGVSRTSCAPCASAAASALAAGGRLAEESGGFAPPKGFCAALPPDGHPRHDQPVVGARLELETLRHAVDHDLLEQLEPGLFLVDDLRRLGVELLALRRIERVARLLHELVEALTRLVPRPVLAAEAVRVEQAPERAVGVEECGLRVDEHQAVRRQGALVVHPLAGGPLHHLDPRAVC